MSKSKKNSKGSRFFTTTKKGEIHELQKELQNGGKKDVQKEAVKKVIAAMTVGKDVSMLFTDVLNCMQTDDIELKKLVYLYVMNYAKSNPDLAILAVNTFKRDTRDPNALIRALAVRTMGCIRVDRITEYLCEPLRRALKDEDPYVRKTAAVCVAKLYDISPELVEVQGFLDMLQDLISDSNPTVVANAVAALCEIQESHGERVMRITTSVLQKLLAALNECTEWGQVFILDSLAHYTPKDGREAESIIERVVPRLKHANSAVVLSAIKVIMRYMDKLEDGDSEAGLLKKMAPPLVSLMSHGHGEFPEIQYVALRNINLIVQKKPAMLTKEIKIFFCKYDDPIYVKMEKLEIIIKLASERNIEQVLMELKEYSREVDVDFVRKSVRAIGRCAIKLERAAERCINVLLDLIQTKVNYVVQEAIIVIKDIFRKYPNRYESIIATLCENLVSLDEPEAKAAMIWIIGEYAERIDNADELLEHFMDSFADEQPQVQLQLLTAVVKLFLKKPNETQDMVQQILNMATEKSDNPDLRDRGYVYWRLLSSSPKAAKMVVLADKPVIADDTCALQPALLDELIANISTLSAIYHKPPEAFVQRKVGAAREADDDSDDSDDSDEDTGTESDEPLEGHEDKQHEIHGGDDDNVDDLLGLGLDEPAPAPAGGGGDLMDDIFGMSAPAPAPAQVQMATVVSGADGAKVGFNMQAAFTKENGSLVLKCLFQNTSNGPMDKLAIQFNKNFFGLKPASPQIVLGGLAPGGTGGFSVPVTPLENHRTPKFDARGIQAALKNMANNQVAFFFCPLDLAPLMTENGELSKQAFLSLWKEIAGDNEKEGVAQNLLTTDLERVKSNFAAKNIFFIADRKIDKQNVAFFSLKLVNGVDALLELRFVAGVDGANVCVKSHAADVLGSILTVVQNTLQGR